jgi:hypothetical protein
LSSRETPLQDCRVPWSHLKRMLLFTSSISTKLTLLRLKPTQRVPLPRRFSGTA